MKSDKIPGIVKSDPWLNPVVHDVTNRYQRFQDKLSIIEQEYGSLGKFADAYKFLGINYDKKLKGWFYREWAPAAHALFLSGDFNDWDPLSHPLHRIDNGIWEIFIEESAYGDKFVHGSKIKVWVDGANGFLPRIPAYITRVVQDEDTKNYSGQLWFKRFNWGNDRRSLPPAKNLFIYECHVGMAQEKAGIGTYIEFAQNVLPWVKQCGYNAIQMMAIQEHPYYGSFGYHVANFFAPSSRFGTPEELKFLIKTAHEMGIAVIMDIVHSHTVKNVNEGLNMFDGSDSQYFHSGERGLHPQWDSMLFDYGKTEVLQFLLSNVKYWLKEFHFDGFRFDGVGSMMYFHHGNETIDSPQKYFTDGVEWDAITYLQLANKLIHSIKKETVTIAEDVTGMPGLASSIAEGGIGFDYRLGMGIPDFWIKLLKESRDEDWNVEELWHVMNNRLPGVRTVAYAESHDQALVGDKTLAFWLMDQEMYWHMGKDDASLIVDRGIALHKLIRLFTISLGGQAYLNFMGNEFGHPEWIDFPREGNNWSYHFARRQWSLATNPELKYRFMALFDQDMIEIIKSYRVLNDEFANQLHIDIDNKIIAFSRGKLIFIFNFNPFNSLPDYGIHLPKQGSYKVVLCSDNKKYGGHGRIDEQLTYQTVGELNMLKLYVTNRSALVLSET
ncbi:MAG: alpha amylase C-terminal domain-containing protein [Lentimicrobiaceae bacterium]|nr:alpha amylase C-terminal domain-containing protein [Lentimicrobiaceae bacterium]MCB9023297.1 alpha amylase C-terminal domain-containing protein [Lentimicrobiaceae bacterium]